MVRLLVVILLILYCNAFF
uniref:Uncharacterized protein n=1 Tax=Anguilla anguilla TaxID=7936 RepID=A0A0E9VC30_ANGAN